MNDDDANKKPPIIILKVVETNQPPPEINERGRENNKEQVQQQNPPTKLLPGTNHCMVPGTLFGCVLGSTGLSNVDFGAAVECPKEYRIRRFLGNQREEVEVRTR